jgi:hypothetical protein
MEIDQLPEAVRSLTFERDGAQVPIHEHGLIKNSPDLPTLFKNHLDMDREINQRVRLPGKDAKPEEVDALFSKLEVRAPDKWLRAQRGVPDKPEGYEYVAPEGVAINDEWVNQARGLAHKLGWSKQDFVEAINFHNGLIGKANAEAANVFKGDPEASKASLKEAWGAEFDKNWTLANEGAEKFFDGDQEMIEALGKSGLALTPKFAEKMMAYAQMTSEDSALPGFSPGTNLDSELEKFKTPGTTEFIALMNGDKDAIAKRDMLYSKKFPGKQEL